MVEKIWELTKKGAAFAFLTAVFGLGVAIFSATQLGFGTRQEFGSGLFPFFVGLVIAVTGLICGLQMMRNEGGETSEQIHIEGNRVWRVFFLAISYLIWLLLTNLLGYVLASLIASLIMSKTMGLKGWMWPIALSLGMTFSMYILFDILFYVDLPRGILD